MSLRLRPYAVDLQRLEFLLNRAQQAPNAPDLAHIVEEDAQWYARFDLRRAQEIQRGAPTAHEALVGLVTGDMPRQARWSHKRVLERLCYTLGRILPNEHLKHLDIEALETLDNMLRWLDAPEWMALEQFVLDGSAQNHTIFDRLNIPWVDLETCEVLDDFFADIDWDERLEILDDPDELLDDAYLWREHVMALREIEACLHDTVQHASGLVLFGD